METLQQLDKQNWQNINTIRVAGGGNTNYVVAKDDIGNWYVKNYSADPKDIIKSAQGLALFGAGPGLAGGGNLIGALAKQRAAANLSRNGLTSAAANMLAPAADGKTDSDRAAALAQPANTAAAFVSHQIQNAKSVYDKATADALDSVRNVEGLKGQIKSAWMQKDSGLTADQIAALSTALDSAAADLQAKIDKIAPPTRFHRRGCGRRNRKGRNGRSRWYERDRREGHDERIGWLVRRVVRRECRGLDRTGGREDR